MTAWQPFHKQLNKLVEGKTYIIEGTRAKLKQSTRFNDTNYAFELNWGKKTKVEGLITGDPVQVPYKFMKISEVIIQK